MHFSREARHFGAPLFSPDLVSVKAAATASSPIAKLSWSDRKGSLFVGSLHELRLRHAVEGPHFENLVDLVQFAAAWKCGARPAQELDKSNSSWFSLYSPTVQLRHLSDVSYPTS